LRSNLLASALDTGSTPADEMLARLEAIIDPKNVAVETVSRQDRPNRKHHHLTGPEANKLLSAPGIDSLVGLRNTALIAVMLCAGLREAEVCALNVSDLYHDLNGDLALYIGADSSERLIPYSVSIQRIVERWLRAANISSGAIFRGIYKSEKKIRDSRLTIRALQDILKMYPIKIDGRKTKLRPYDLRRSYAQRLYESGADLLVIQQQLGHADLKTTLGYIDYRDRNSRGSQSPAIVEFESLETALSE
jgi:integrase/recombinase XerD